MGSGKSLKHLSIRVPWHDNGWNGSVCKHPEHNQACLKLPRIAGTKDDQQEMAVCGKLINEISAEDWPACVTERGMFMAPFDFQKVTTHPYAQSNQATHGHMAPTSQTFPAYSAAAVPFRWLMNDESRLHYYQKELGLLVDKSHEPQLPFNTIWYQAKENQKEIMNHFTRQIEPQESLCIFYAKQVPFVEDSRRVIIGIGKVTGIIPAKEYDYSSDGPVQAMLWENMVKHSIRPDFKDGFIMPYVEMIQYADEHPDFDLRTITAFAPDDRIDEFSYASEHVTHDAAITCLLECANALSKMSELIEGPWDRCLKWIDARIAETWEWRGAYPGLGVALAAFGVELGMFVAKEILDMTVDNEDPWQNVDKVFQKPEKYLSKKLAGKIGSTQKEVWAALSKERKQLLKLLSRFELSKEQAMMLYVTEERLKQNISCADQEILENPYRIYEATRKSENRISLPTIDMGVFPMDQVRNQYPLQPPSAIETGVDKRRVRALVVQLLEAAAESGHTLLPRDMVVNRIREMPLEPDCMINGDIMNVVENSFQPEIELVEMADGSRAYQLTRLRKMNEVIKNMVEKRVNGKRHEIGEDWEALIDKAFGAINETGEEKEKEVRARKEKAAVLRELAESRFSVLIGPAGTGKTTLLSILCSQRNIMDGEVLLLAPTGKARVRIEEIANAISKEQGSTSRIKAFTLAQHLGKTKRYDYKTQQYQLSDNLPEEMAKTVIVDEGSMLTEEMLAALIQSLKGVHRLIIVGDPSQLPPIGPGRPFVDMVTYLRPENVDSVFPRVGKGYGELTVTRRQAGEDRLDLRVAEWFSGRSLAPGEDDIFDRLNESATSNRILVKQWDTPEELHQHLLDTLVNELELKDIDDNNGFDKTLGATEYNGVSYFNKGTARSAEKWQILSPVRNMPHGVFQLNRLIHKRFKSNTIAFANRIYRKIPKPMGVEEIVYGDKVINISNHRRKNVWPAEGAQAYIANGEIGIVQGQLKTKKFNKTPWELKVEFSSQIGYQYGFGADSFGDERDSMLELAYALTVHKSQGSQFELVILVLPNPCLLLSKELLYTALTRQQNKVVMLHQGSFADLKKYSSEVYSETARRLTNLFNAPKLVEVKNTFLDENLIHRTANGELVRSKSEVIIADHLFDKGIIYTYEKPLKRSGAVRYPDFTIEDDASGEEYFWEHCGMMFDAGYRRRWELKKEWYRENGILPIEEGGNLIITEDAENGGIDSKKIRDIIEKLF